jgi:HEAT repeat protein
VRLLVAQPLLVLHLVFGWSLSSLARRRGDPRSWWAWMPVLNLLLPFAMARRSLGWSALLAVPPLNVLVWATVWAEVFAEAGRRAWLGLLMAVPGPNLVVPAYAAGEPSRRIAAALVLAVASLGAAWAAHREMDTEAAGAIARIGMTAPADGEALVAGLLEAARGSGERLMPDVALVDALAAAGPAAPSLLRDALRDPDPGVRWHAAAAFMHIGSRAGDVAPALLAAMDDPVWTVRNASGRALEDVATAADVPLLARALGDPSAETRYHVARALARTGPAAAAAVPELVAGLGDDDWEVRLESARALGAVGAAAGRAFAALKDLLHGDREPQVRAAAALSLAVVEPGEPADEALRRALDDPVPEVQRAARAALAWRARARAS